MWKLVKLVQTAKNTDDRLAEKEIVSGIIKTKIMLAVDPKQRYQNLEGFGGAFTESSVVTLDKHPEAREKILKAYFDPEEGLGYSLCRTHMNSCDFSLGNYNYIKDHDESLDSFDISREKMHMLPAIKDAIRFRGAPVKLFVSPWSPPGWMKDTGQMNHGGKLLEKYRSLWARYFIKFIQVYESEGIPIWGLTIQNEPAAVQPWDSCIYSAKEEGEFVRDHLGPELEKAGLARIKVMVWDHNKDLIYDRAKATLGVPGAAKFIWGIAFHWYSGDDFKNLHRTWKEFGDKALLFSEGCIEKGPRLGDWNVGERYAHDMIGNFNNGCVGFTDWNMVLDETGGPNHVGNFCDAPVNLNTLTGEITWQNSFYYIGQFSKYALPGAVRVECRSDDADVEATAFLNSDGILVVVSLNRTDKTLAFGMSLGTYRAEAVMPPHSIQTRIFQER